MESELVNGCADCGNRPFRVGVIECFQNPIEETGIPYQNLINRHLRKCAKTHKDPPPLLGLLSEPQIGRASAEFGCFKQPLLC